MTAALSPEGLWFLPFALPVCLYIVWTDLKFMRIPNVAVVALFAGFVLVGPFVLELSDYAWRFAHVAVVLVIGFLLNQVGGFGAGDAKFAAAMAAFVPLSDVSFVIYLFAGVMISAWVLHRTARRIGPLRRATPDWISWDRRDFPMGVALGPTLALYLIATGLAA